MHSMLKHCQSTKPLHILYYAVVIGFLRRGGPQAICRGILDFVGTLQQI